MKLRLPLLFLFAMSLLGADSGSTFTLLDWNIDRGYDLDKIAAVIRSQPADIAILQEVDLHAKRTNRADVAKELAEKLEFQYAFGQAFQEVNQGTSDEPAYQGQATLTRFPIQNKRVVQFSHQTGFWKPQPYLPSWTPQRRMGGRVALVAELQVLGRRVVTYNLHLESRGPGYNRHEQLKEVLADAKTYSPDIPMIIAGDLNTKYYASHFVSLLESAGFHDCFNGHRERTHRIIGNLDWIFVRGPITCEDTKVLRDARGSDHYPIAAKVTFK